MKRLNDIREKKKRSDQEIFQKKGREKRKDRNIQEKQIKKFRTKEMKSQTPGPTEDLRKGILKDTILQLQNNGNMRDAKCFWGYRKVGTKSYSRNQNHNYIGILISNNVIQKSVEKCLEIKWKNDFQPGNLS